MGTSRSDRKRLVADRFRRIWHVVEEVAACPGRSRAELADLFHLSERQVQADLNIIRVDMRLPLVRRQGYRFVDDVAADGERGGFSLQDAQLLVMIARQAARDRSVPSKSLASLLERLPLAFPPHVRPLVQQTVSAIMAPPSKGQQVLLALTEAMLRDRWVRLHCAPGTAVSPPEPVMRPSLLLPYLGRWYVLGEHQHDGRTRMLALADVVAVTLADADGRS